MSAFNLSALSAYINQESNVREIYRRAMYGNDTAPFITQIDGVKKTNALPSIDHSRNALINAENQLTLSDAKGEIEVKQVNLLTTKLAYLRDFRLDDLEGFFAQQYLPRGAEYGLGDLETVLAVMLGSAEQFGIPAVINRQVEGLTWQGDTDLDASTGLNLVDGFMKLLAEVDATSIGALTVENTLGFVDGLINAAMEDADWKAAIMQRNQAYLYMGGDTWRKYELGYRKEHGSLNYNNEFRKAMPDGTEVMMIPCSGLTGTDHMYLARPEAMVQGADLSGDKDQIGMGFTEIHESIWVKTKFRFGLQCRDKSDKSVLIHRPTIS